MWNVAALEIRSANKSTSTSIFTRVDGFDINVLLLLQIVLAQCTWDWPGLSIHNSHAKHSTAGNRLDPFDIFDLQLSNVSSIHNREFGWFIHRFDEIPWKCFPVALNSDSCSNTIRRELVVDVLPWQWLIVWSMRCDTKATSRRPLVSSTVMDNNLENPGSKKVLSLHYQFQNFNLLPSHLIQCQ